MKRLSMLLAIILLAGCASTGDTSGLSGTQGFSGSGSTNQMDINRHDNPADTYFGG